MRDALDRAHAASRDGLEGLGERVGEQLGELTASIRRLEAKLDRSRSSDGSPSRRNRTSSPQSDGGPAVDEGYSAAMYRKKTMAQRHSAVVGDPPKDAGKVRSGSRWGSSAVMRGNASEFTDEDDSDSRSHPQRQEGKELPRSRSMDMHENTQDRGGVPPAAVPTNPLQAVELSEGEEEGANKPDKLENGIDLKLDGLDEKLKRIAFAVGASADVGTSEEEDRRRLKEKLKEALESAARNSILEIESSEREVWLEYIFGICKPDGRIGKAGSRYSSDHPLFVAFVVLVWSGCSGFCWSAANSENETIDLVLTALNLILSDERT
jgi:hypothetical protein